MIIYSYIDTLLDKWINWNALFLTERLASNTNSINDILNATGSDNPSRAKEMFRIGLLKEELSTGDSAWNKLRNDVNIQSELGYLSALIYSAYKRDKTNLIIKRGLGGLCGIFSIVQSEQIGKYEVSINTLIFKLLSIFPCAEGYNELTWIRYVLSAAFCEIKYKNTTQLEQLLTGVASGISLRIIEEDQTTKSINIRATFSNANDVKKAIDTKLSLTKILFQKGALFAIGENMNEDPRGFYGLAYNLCYNFLKQCFLEEIKDVSNSPFVPLYKESALSEKTNSIRFLNSIDSTNDKYKTQYKLVMKDIKQGAKEALKVLFDDDITTTFSEQTRNLIIYGAPGTGKSHRAKYITEAKSKTVVTFHPDTDYSAFVGAYKPTLHENGTDITYGFVPQAFAKAYVNAWKDTSNDYYLVIEEINRGNCAQIFGDIFQLLDRNAEGYSDYVIDVDKDFEGYLKTELLGVEGYQEKITELAEAAELEGDFSFAKVALPANLHIIATMNTSDQSLFPMDSAFKRRWDWVYLPINYEKASEIKIDIDGEQYNWGEFIGTVNEKIKEINNSEDKQLGTFFAKAKEGVISFEQFRSKVMFYLWFEVYKDEAGTGDSIFKRSDDDSKGFSFGELFESNATVIIKDFLKFLKVNPMNPSSIVSAEISTEPDKTE